MLDLLVPLLLVGLLIAAVVRSLDLGGRPDRDAVGGTTLDVTPGVEGADVVPPWSLFSAELVQRRLAELADELDRLDRDRTIFARAFHTGVARAAYDALRDEQRRQLADVSVGAPGGDPGRRVPARREELEL